MADTSFLVKSTMCLNAPNDNYAKQDHELIRDFKKKLISTGCKIIYNATAKTEILHVIREVMIRDAIALRKIDDRDLNTSFLSLCSDIDNDFNRTVKKLLKNGYINFFNELFGNSGEHLLAEFNYRTSNCSYVSFDGKLDWNDAILIMSQYALDSSDAMIINSAVKTEDCAGLLTADQDYKYCYDIPNFDIIFPSRFNTKNPKSYSCFS